MIHNLLGDEKGRRQLSIFQGRIKVDQLIIMHSRDIVGLREYLAAAKPWQKERR